MCGIAGFVGPGDRHDLAAMAGAMIHRGPDDEGYYIDETSGVHLAHRRLSIIDLADGAQPMSTPDGELVVVFNGEIYNHLELRRELIKAGHRFVTDHSDTEVLLHGYRQWGADLPNRLNGMWALAIHDRPAGRLFLSRDRFGQKPLFYTFQGGRFAFASELTSLSAHSGLNFSLSRLSVIKYMAYGFIPAPRTIYREAAKLSAGCNLIFNLDGQPKIDRYWKFVLEPTDNPPADPEGEWGEEFRSILSRAVGRRLMSDVPLGLFLSGGIDSSSVAHMAVAAAGRDMVESFSVGFDDPTFDETPFSDRMGRLLGTRHTSRRLPLAEARVIAPEVLDRMDEPLGDSSLIPTFLLCRQARKRVTVALGGDGADELFAGYSPFLALNRAKMYRRLVPRPVHRAIRLVAARLPTSHRYMSLDFKIKRTLRGLTWPEKLWNPVWLGPLEPSELVEAFGGPIDPEEVYSEAIELWDDGGRADPVDRTLAFYTNLYLVDDILTKVDRASMLNSLEVRSPYLDLEMVDFARKIPWRFKLDGGRTKYLMKAALEPILPPVIVHRSKQGFALPIGAWLGRGEIDPPVTGETGGVDPGFIQARLAEHRSGRDDHRLFLWNQLALNRFLGGRGRA